MSWIRSRTRGFVGRAAPRERWHRGAREPTRPMLRVWALVPGPRRAGGPPRPKRGREWQRAARDVEGVGRQVRPRGPARATARPGTGGGRRCVRAHAVRRPTGRDEAPGRSRSLPGRGPPQQLAGSVRGHPQRCRPRRAPRWPRRSLRELHRTTATRSAARAWPVGGGRAERTPGRWGWRARGCPHLAGAGQRGRTGAQYSAHGISPTGTPSRKDIPVVCGGTPAAGVRARHASRCGQTRWPAR